MSYEKTSFVQALSGTCRGTDVFLSLMRQHPLRTALHLLTMLALCSLFVTAVRFFASENEIDKVAERFRSVFGGLAFHGNVALPEKQPRQSRSMILPERGVLVYVPDGENPAPSDGVSLADFRYALYWMQDEFLFARKIGEDDWICLRFRSDATITEQTRTDMAGLESALRAIGSNRGARPAAVSPPGKAMTVDEMKSVFKTSWTLITFLMFFFSGAVQTVFYTGVFAVMTQMFGVRRLRRIRFCELWRILVYAGFPAMMVASAFDAFDLPLLSFGSAYVIGMILYALTVINRIEREISPSGDSR